MPKLKRSSKLRSKTSTSPIVEAASQGTNSSSNVKGDDDDGDKKILSRGQRKRLAKREQYLKRDKMIMSSLRVKREEEQRGRIDGLDAIKEALTQTIKMSQKLDEAELDHTSKQNEESAKSNKGKKHIAQKELTHFNLVLQHPSFKANPFETMQEHLKNTLAGNAKDLEKNAEDERRRLAKIAEERKEIRKERIRNAKYEKGRKHRWRRNQYS